MSTQAPSPVDSHPEASIDEVIEKDELFHLLQNGRRRAVVRFLHLHREEVESVFEMRTIAEQVAAWENDKPVAQLNSNERQRVYISLYQSHLPKLAAAGVIKYKQARGRVEPTTLLSQLEPYLIDDSESDDPSPEQPTPGPTTAAWYYSSATIVSIGLLTMVTLGLAPALIAGSLGTIVMALFVVTTVGVRYRGAT